MNLSDEKTIYRWAARELIDRLNTGRASLVGVDKVLEAESNARAERDVAAATVNRLLRDLDLIGTEYGQTAYSTMHAIIDRLTVEERRQQPRAKRKGTR